MDNEPVYEVPADDLEGPVRCLDTQDVDVINARFYSVDDVVLVASLLAKVPKFPFDMIDKVLELADFLVGFQAETNAIQPGQNNMDEIYLELNLPTAHDADLPAGISLVPACRHLVVECTSHDQGWATFENEHNGTYNASYTWSEVAVVKRDEGGNASEVARRTVAANMRANRQFRHHVKQFSDTEGFVKDITLGDSLRLILRSQYPGWTNTAKYGRLCARFAVEICEDARLLSTAELQAYSLAHSKGKSWMGGCWSQ